MADSIMPLDRSPSVLGCLVSRVTKYSQPSKNVFDGKTQAGVSSVYKG
ncbi:hypothetical protein FPSE_02950 [Fusarium pseudograminearum CS3096]|uniref:Uncharacterized protein n=1 Tax=Fusarium pseudograminearum (strain CS3096) TaxID=1028729 RepID=K3VPE5_FUSPC|nr:hypothetical protein FPSE_02950 [Fusarium pseudograminearum CS3096]EKJ76764.1 hypothetical protein FPSE_02950 [Fusarium pseudograminearum CS3096]